MKEYLFLIRNDSNSKEGFSAELHLEFLDKCRVYIEQLERDGKMISAQPLVRDGVIVSGKAGSWTEVPYNEHKEVIVGYYHILANNLEDAIAIAKGNPEFEYTDTARLEVRPIKMKEETTSYVYPKG